MLVVQQVLVCKEKFKLKFVLGLLQVLVGDKFAEVNVSILGGLLEDAFVRDWHAQAE